MAYCI